MEYIGVIGGLGFIGSKIVEKLKASGYKVRVLDIKEPEEKSDEYQQVDITNCLELIEATKNLDGLIHLGAVVGVDICNSKTELVEKVNFGGVKNVVKACKCNGINHLLFSSSSEVYGDGAKVPFREDDSKFPKSTYGKTKLKAEEYLSSQASHNLKISVVRYFNVYGLNQRRDFVMTKFAEMALADKNLTVFGDGKQVRCYTHIEDAIEGTMLVYENQKKAFDIFHIANPRPLTVNELAQIVIQISGASIDIDYVELNDSLSRPEEIEIFRRIPSIDKISNAFGFEPKISVEEGVMEIIEGIRDKKGVELYGN